MRTPYITACRECKKELRVSSLKYKYHAHCNPKRKKNKKYPREFYNAAPFIRIRDKYCCQDCHRYFGDQESHKPNPPVHHINGNIKDNDTKNLVLLCISCHLNIHRLGLKNYNVKRINIPTSKELFSPVADKQFFKNIPTNQSRELT